MVWEQVFTITTGLSTYTFDGNKYRYRLSNSSGATVVVSVNESAVTMPDFSTTELPWLYGSKWVQVLTANKIANIERELINTAPTQPGAFTSPVGVLAMGDVKVVTWGMATDAEESREYIEYILEMKKDSGSWSLVTAGISSGYTTLSQNFTVPAVNSLQFRVKAKDRGGLESAYRESPVYTVSRNAAPSLILDTTNARTLYEADALTIAGTATDTDSGNVVNVKYQLNGGTVRAIIAQISAGVAIPFSKALTFKGGKLYDGIADITGTLAEGTSHTLKVWSEDDQGGKSAEQTRTFQVIANRPAVITVAPFTPTSGQIDSDTITISGTVSDPDGNSVVLKYKIGSGSLIDVYAGIGGPFSFAPKLSALAVGNNTVTIQATDSYGAVSTKTLQVTKAGSSTQLKTSTIRYKLTPPNGSAKGVVLWIQRETGDLTVSAEISMAAAGEPESFVPMTKSATAYVAQGLEEDEFKYEAATVKADITLKLTVTRASTASTSGIKLISGVLS